MMTSSKLGVRKWSYDHTKPYGSEAFGTSLQEEVKKVCRFGLQKTQTDVKKA